MKKVIPSKVLTSPYSGAVQNIFRQSRISELDRVVKDTRPSAAGDGMKRFLDICQITLVPATIKKLNINLSETFS